MAKKRLEDCRRKRDFVKWARRRGAHIKEGGRHTKICYDGYAVPIPSHGEIRKGTRHSIMKSLKKIGLTKVVLTALFVAGSLAAGGFLALLVGA